MSYNSRKSAQSAARKALGSDYANLCTIAQDEAGAWNWTKNAESAPVANPEPVAPSEPVEPVEPQATPAEPVESEETSDKNPEPQGPSMLAGLLGNMTGDVPVNPPAPIAKPEPKSSGLKVEKDRPMQNGVKRPSAGGLCRAVWDACWAHQEKTGCAPTAADVKGFATANGWNPNNASIEYYQWRKYNGITGRVAKAKVEDKKPEAPQAAPVVVAVVPPMDVQMPMNSKVSFA